MVYMTVDAKHRNSREYCFAIHKQHLLLHISCCNRFMATLVQVIHLQILFVFDLENPITQKL